MDAEIKQATPSELWRWLALQAIHKAAQAAGTPREAADLGAYGIQAGVNLTRRALGMPQTPQRDFAHQSGLLPRVDEAEPWLMKQLNPYLPADTGWKPPIIERGILPTDQGGGILSGQWTLQ
jgi:hypothetical protein